MKPATQARASFQVDRALMDAFAAFSGDHSPLHMDPDFAARSRYGSTVVHGVLPLLALPALVQELLPERTWSVRQVQARFLRPILPDDSVELIATLESGYPEPAVHFELRRAGQDSPCTTGSLRLIPSTASGHAEQNAAGPSALCPPPLLAEHVIEDLAPGRSTELAFSWDAPQRQALQDLLHHVLPAHRHPAWAEPFLALLALLSTQVGMVMPGRYATFQEFDLGFTGGHAPGSGAGTLRALVASVSSTSRSLVQDVRFDLEGKLVAEGRLVVQVARSPYVPPTMDELATTALDHGLAGRVVLITGASRGLGATTAKLFALHGARVVVNYRSAREQADAVVDDILRHGGEAMAVQADVSDEGAVRGMIDRIGERWGAVDVLVNNAVGNFRPIPFSETTWGQVEQDLSVILKGAFLVTQAVLPGMVAAGGGSIVNVSTLAVESPPRDQSKYVMAKSALNGLTRSLAVELAPRKIRVNMVVPGMMETDLTSGTDRIAVAQLKAATPLKRLAEPREVAQAIVFLASAQAGSTTGQKVLITGGLPPFL